MYKESLYAKTEQILEQIENKPIFKDFYLVGGTALALQLGHRKSVDLDWFTDRYPKHDVIKQSFPEYATLVIHETHGTIDLVINDVKVSFLEYKYPLLNPLVDFEYIKMASVEDIGCMKLAAVSSRGSKKDFVDLFFILKEFPLDTLIKAFHKKFTGVNYQEMHLFKSLVYFDDAEQDPDPDYLVATSWQDVKSVIENEVKRNI